MLLVQQRPWRRTTTAGRVPRSNPTYQPPEPEDYRTVDDRVPLIFFTTLSCSVPVHRISTVPDKMTQGNNGKAGSW